MKKPKSIYKKPAKISWSFRIPVPLLDSLRAETDRQNRGLSTLAVTAFEHFLQLPPAERLRIAAGGPKMEDGE